jgi:hypothetical protein
MTFPNEIVLDVDFARDFLYMKIGDKNEGYELVAHEDHGKIGRWSIGGAVVIRDIQSTALYRALYSEGATEEQAERPWDEDDEVTFKMVRPVPVVKVRYEEVAA